MLEKTELKKKTRQIKVRNAACEGVCVCPRLQSIHTEYLQVISKRNEVFWQSDVDTHCYCEGCTGWKTFFINNHSVRQGWNSLPEHNALTNILKNQENVNLRGSFRQSGAKPAALRQQQQKHPGMDDKEFTGGANSFNTEQQQNTEPLFCCDLTFTLNWLFVAVQRELRWSETTMTSFLLRNHPMTRKPWETREPEILQRDNLSPNNKHQCGSL